VFYHLAASALFFIMGKAWLTIKNLGVQVYYELDVSRRLQGLVESIDAIRVPSHVPIPGYMH